jgi:hypothetical protein
MQDQHEMLRRCDTCDLPKTKRGFRYDADKREHSTTCRCCQARISRAKGEKKCATCCKVKPRAQFNLKSQNTDGLEYDCKACVKVYRRRYTQGLTKGRETSAEAAIARQEERDREWVAEGWEQLRANTEAARG